MNQLTKTFLSIALPLCGALVATDAFAHAIWFAQRSTRLAVIYGTGADDLDAVRRIPLLTEVRGFDAGWKEVQATVQAVGPLALVQSESDLTMVAAVLFNGIWSKTPDGKWHKKGRDEVADAVISEKNYKYAVHVRWPLGAELPLIPTHRLQIVPVEKMLPELLGRPLKLRVLFDGKPAAGARVLRDLVNDPDAKPQITGTDGVVTIEVRNQGLNVVAAIFDGRSDEPAKAEKMEHLATLSFVLPHLPE